MSVRTLILPVLVIIGLFAAAASVSNTALRGQLYDGMGSSAFVAAPAVLPTESAPMSAFTTEPAADPAGTAPMSVPTTDAAMTSEEDLPDAEETYEMISESIDIETDGPGTAYAYGDYAYAGTAAKVECKQISKKIRINHIESAISAKSAEDAKRIALEPANNRLKELCEKEDVPACEKGCETGSQGARVTNKTSNTAEVVSANKYKDRKGGSYRIRVSGGGCDLVRHCVPIKP